MEDSTSAYTSASPKSASARVSALPKVASARKSVLPKSPLARKSATPKTASARKSAVDRSSVVGRRGVGFSTAELLALLAGVEEILPCCSEEWEEVLEVMKDLVPDCKRTAMSVQKKFQKMHRTAKGSGDEVVPGVVKRAKLLKQHIIKKMQCHTRDTVLDWDDDDLSGFEVPAESFCAEKELAVLVTAGTTRGVFDSFDVDPVLCPENEPAVEGAMSLASGSLYEEVEFLGKKQADVPGGKRALVQKLLRTQLRPKKGHTVSSVLLTESGSDVAAFFREKFAVDKEEREKDMVAELRKLEMKLEDSRKEREIIRVEREDVRMQQEMERKAERDEKRDFLRLMLAKQAKSHEHIAALFADMLKTVGSYIAEKKSEAK